VQSQKKPQKHLSKRSVFVHLQCRINPNKMIQVSESARVKITNLLEEEGLGDDACIRVCVTSGGCSGLSYKMDFVAQPEAEDKLFSDNGVTIAVEKRSLLYLAGTTLEYSGGLNGKGFSFNNPNASRTCGCGESFAV
jgi:iron-sulfur cluster assembly protein